MNNDKTVFSYRNVIDKKTIISFLVSFAIIAFLIKSIDINEVLKASKNLNVTLFIMAIVVHYISFLIRGLRWKKLLKNINVNVGTLSVTEMVFLSWFANSIVPAKMGDVYRSHLLKKETNTPISNTIGTIMIERIFDILLLLVLLSISGFLLFKNKMPDEIFHSIEIGYILLVIIMVGLVFFITMKEKMLRIIPEKFHFHFINFHDSIFDSFSDRKTMLYVIVTTALTWFFESSRFLLVTKSMGLELAIPAIIFVVLASSLLTAIPLTPAGLGAVEVSIVFILGIMGVDTNIAAAVALLDRLISYWSVLLTGSIVYIYSNQK
ncbi:hypothetical protein SAMN04488589_0957 [Methanolobus vulcani]|uniref:Integral membrane protein n=1 Tax=Methanolobus vulcani TaxID=38026 RepID=A0A7Z7AVT2_9EURY|nr:lysylphosphatidylglycerol synthase transmembrane domain-containing protein [Methanolobus vulcani]SDF58522.1 hypothetical protein SAMN04488589_0957 [Methanolobus vulcani]